MNLGTAILLSSLIIGMAILIGLTKDRWNWLKFFKITAFWLFMFIFLGSTIGFIIYKYVNRPKVINEYWGLTLNDTYTDVNFKKGGYSRTSLNSTGGTQYIVEDGQNQYTFEFSTTTGKLNKIECAGDMGCPSIQGIGTWSNSKDLLKKFGEPTLIATKDGETKRMYMFGKYNVFFKLEKDKVFSLGIYEGS